MKIITCSEEESQEIMGIAYNPFVDNDNDFIVDTTGMSDDTIKEINVVLAENSHRIEFADNFVMFVVM